MFDIKDYNTKLGDCQELFPLKECEIPQTSESCFAPFNPFESDTATATNPFPIFCLPKTVENYVKAVSIFTQTPLEMAGGLHYPYLRQVSKDGIQ